MASNYTESYGLCQWEATDQVLRTEFNENNAKIDAALKGLAAQDVALGELVSKCGNCKMYLTTYTGKGSAITEQSISFPWLPWVVIIMGADGYTMITTPEQKKIYINPSSVYTFATTWNSNTLSWPIDNKGADRMNALDTLYRVVALGVAE